MGRSRVGDAGFLPLHYRICVKGRPHVRDVTACNVINRRANSRRRTRSLPVIEAKAMLLHVLVFCRPLTSCGFNDIVADGQYRSRELALQAVTIRGEHQRDGVFSREVGIGGARDLLVELYWQTVSLRPGRQRYPGITARLTGLAAPW